jgi:hypothetical protein
MTRCAAMKTVSASIQATVAAPATNIVAIKSQQQPVHMTPCCNPSANAERAATAPAPFVQERRKNRFSGVNS